MDRQVMPTTLRLIVATILLSLPPTTSAEEDPHDKLVYSRYSRKCQPTTFKLPPREERVQLDHPATLEDVKAGLAIFSFEGLGKRRVAELPGVDPEWRRGINVPAYWNRPRVYQAEELEVDGKWKRYYGVHSAEGAAVVPAQEWETYWPDAPWIPGQGNLFPIRPGRDPFEVPDDNPLGGNRVLQNLSDANQLYWHATIQRPAPGTWIRDLDDPLKVTVHFANWSPRPKTVPAKWTGIGHDGKPAILNVVSLSLEWAPFDPDYPFLRESVQLERRRSPGLERDAGTRIVKPDEACKLFAFDLRDWFEIQEEGYYKLTVTIWWAGLEFACREPESECQFTVGKPPRQPTIEQYNKTLPVLGGPENEARLKKLIKDTIKPKPSDPNPLPPDLARIRPWSEPVNGLAARIDALFDWRNTTVFVRLKNVSQQPMVVPACNPRDRNAAQPFELYARQGDGLWRKVPCFADSYYEYPAPDEDGDSGSRRDALHAVKADRPMVTLRPGEDCLVFIQGHDAQDDGQPKEFRVVLRQTETSPEEQDWGGGVETPPFSTWPTVDSSSDRSDTLPLPTHFPKFSHCIDMINACVDEPAVEGLWCNNRELFDLLPLYDPDQVCREFERRMLAETRLSMKLFLAVVAARAGSERAALYLLEMAKETDCRICFEVHRAIALLFPYTYDKVPPWVVELSLAILADERLLTGTEGSPWDGSCFTIGFSDFDGYLLAELTDIKCRKVVPLLVERIKQGRGGRDEIYALGEIGDERAIPILLELLEQTDWTNARNEHGYLLQPFDSLIYTLGKLKAKQAVPLLLKFIEHPEVIDCLGSIGDPVALPILREIAAKRDDSNETGRTRLTEFEMKRIFTAKMALCTWDSDGGVARLWQLYRDKSISRNQRYSVGMELGNCRDPNAIPALIEIVQKDDDPYIIEMAICNLHRFKHMSAAKGLIDCFDVEFKEEYLGKGERVTPATFRNQIARTLQELTGQSFGSDKQQWLQWWQQQGQHDPNLK